MQFKTNHSPGPWSFDFHDIRDANGHYIIDTDDIQKMSDIKAIAQVPAMLAYMMARARAMSIYGFSAAENSELKRILAILKDAGVEVVEK